MVESYWRGNFCVEVHPAPGTLVIFGASGDLAARKLYPALFRLFRRGLFHEESRIVGCARTSYDDDAFRTHIAGHLDGSEEEKAEFLRKLYYFSGEYDDSLFYHRLGERLWELENGAELPQNRTFYLATPTDLYPSLVRELGGSGLLREEPGAPWRHVIFEKPFGHDLESARELDAFLHRYLEEEQIYRIDHYLGKETVQNILMLRFANLIFEPLWNAHYIDHVQITVAETLGVERRAGYYDRTGLLRDMFQNHMLEMLSLAAMEMPSAFTPEAIRDENIKLIRSIRPFDCKCLPEQVVRAQYRGYRGEPGIPPGSQTETYVAARLQIDNWRWAGVPFYLRSGKKLAAKKSEIAIVFKHIPHSIFAPIRSKEMQPDALILKVQPDEGIELCIQAKQPGPKLCMGGLGLNFSYSSLPGGELFEAYDRLLLDAMLGDQTLFLRSDVIAEGWKLFTPLLEMWGDCPLEEYEPGSEGPMEAERLLLRENREWRAI